jgi:hypothetical protein
MPNPILTGMPAGGLATREVDLLKGPDHLSHETKAKDSQVFERAEMVADSLIHVAPCG